MRPRLPFAIIYEDRDIIVVDKPAGMLTTPTRALRRSDRESQYALENILRDYVRKGQARSRAGAWPVNRLDRGTSGVVMFAKSEDLAATLRARWSEIAEKTYLARVEGVVSEPNGVFQSFLRDNNRTMKVESVPDERDGKFAVTEWRRISDNGKTTLVEVHPKTGRKNQIRVHFADAGHPIVGDAKYGAKPADRLHLHSLRLVVDLPGGRKTFEARMPS